MAYDVCLITAEPAVIGAGHLSRMRAVEKKLLAAGLSTVLCQNTAAPITARVYVLDQRDEAFPEWAGQNRLAIDNLGQGARQARANWYCLPNLTMPHAEALLSLQNIILPDQFSSRPNLSHRARVYYAGARRPEVAPGDYLWLPPGQRVFIAEGFLSLRQRQLLDATRVVTYFGQTFFEALYLGKEIVLYDIGDYHRQLSQLTMKLLSSNLWPRYFRGQGLSRLADQIRSLALS